MEERFISQDRSDTGDNDNLRSKDIRQLSPGNTQTFSFLNFFGEESPKKQGNFIGWFGFSSFLLVIIIGVYFASYAYFFCSHPTSPKYLSSISTISDYATPLQRNWQTPPFNDMYFVHYDEPSQFKNTESRDESVFETPCPSGFLPIGPLAVDQWSHQDSNPGSHRFYAWKGFTTCGRQWADAMRPMRPRSNYVPPTADPDAFGCGTSEVHCGLSGCQPGARCPITSLEIFTNFSSDFPVPPLGHEFHHDVNALRDLPYRRQYFVDETIDVTEQYVSYRGKNYIFKLSRNETNTAALINLRANIQTLNQPSAISSSLSTISSKSSSSISSLKSSIASMTSLSQEIWTTIKGKLLIFICLGDRLLLGFSKQCFQGIDDSYELVDTYYDWLDTIPQPFTTIEQQFYNDNHYHIPSHDSSADLLPGLFFRRTFQLQNPKCTTTQVNRMLSKAVDRSDDILIVTQPIWFPLLCCSIISLVLQISIALRRYYNMLQDQDQDQEANEQEATDQTLKPFSHRLPAWLSILCLIINICIVIHCFVQTATVPAFRSLTPKIVSMKCFSESALFPLKQYIDRLDSYLSLLFASLGLMLIITALFSFLTFSAISRSELKGARADFFALQTFLVRFFTFKWVHCNCFCWKKQDALDSNLDQSSTEASGSFHNYYGLFPLTGFSPIIDNNLDDNSNDSIRNFPGLQIQDDISTRFQENAHFTHEELTADLSFNNEDDSDLEFEHHY